MFDCLNSWTCCRHTEHSATLLHNLTSDYDLALKETERIQRSMFIGVPNIWWNQWICFSKQSVQLHHFISVQHLFHLHNSDDCLLVIPNKMGESLSTFGKRKGAYRILVGRPEGRRPLGRPSRRWKDILKTDLQEVRLGVDWLICFWIGTGSRLLCNR
jgi:hypothetical protein